MQISNLFSWITEGPVLSNRRQRRAAKSYSRQWMGGVLYGVWVYETNTASKEKVPPHYWTSWMDVPDDESKEETTWSIADTATRVVRVVLEKPIARAAYWTEKCIRGDFESAIELTEQNIENLKSHNMHYQQQAKRLEPLADTMGQINQEAQAVLSMLDSSLSSTPKDDDQLLQEDWKKAQQRLQNATKMAEVTGQILLDKLSEYSKLKREVEKLNKKQEAPLS